MPATVNVRDYGAQGDGTANDGPAVAAAIAAVQGRTLYAGPDSGGTVYFPPGRYRCTQMVQVPKFVYLQGETAYASKLILDAPTPIGHFVEFGTAGNIDTYGGVRGLQVDAAGKADVAVYLYGPQEGCGVVESWVLGALVTGVEVEATGISGGTDKFLIDRCWVWTSGDAGVAGFKAEGGTMTVRSSTFVGTNRVGAPPAGSAGILATDATLVVSDVNCELWENAFSLTRSSAELYGPSAFACTHGLRCSSDNTDYPVFLTNAKWGLSGDAIVDTGSSVTLASASSYWNAGRTIVDPKHYTRGWLNYDGVQIFRSASSTIHYLWVDSSGRLRIKNSQPTSDTDGTVVGSQS